MSDAGSEANDEGRRADRMQVLGHLAAAIAHDFNNVLSIVLGYACILQKELEDDERLSRYAESIADATENAADMTRQLLEFGRSARLERRILDLSQLLQRMRDMIGRLLGHRIELVIDEADGPLTVAADVGEVQQVLLNLIVNARDAMPDGGTLTITVAPDQPAEASFESTFVRLTVRDDGLGMEPEVRRHAFDEFFTTKPSGRGTGLGLHAVQSIVERLQGRIEIESTPGAGTAVHVLLPISRGEAAPLQRLEGGQEAEIGVGTVLLIEHHDRVRELTRTVLERAGYLVLSAPDTSTALRIVDQWRGDMDVVITDLELTPSERLDLSERLREQQPGVRILHLSNRDEPSMVVSGNPPARRLAKPVRPERLIRELGDLLGE